MSRSKPRAVGLTILVILLLGFADSHAEQLPIRTYTTADGLARDRVYKIVSDPRGYLWFCTYDVVPTDALNIHEIATLKTAAIQVDESKRFPWSNRATSS